MRDPNEPPELEHLLTVAPRSTDWEAWQQHALLVALSQAPFTVNILLGPDLVFELVHPLTVKALGGRHVVGRPVLEAVPELRGHQVIEQLLRVIETGERIEMKRQRFRIETESGIRESYWDQSYLPLRDLKGTVRGVITFGRDVTSEIVPDR